MLRSLLASSLILAACGGPSKKADGPSPSPDPDPPPEEPAAAAICQPLDELGSAVSFLGDADLEGEELLPNEDGDAVYRSTLSLPGADCIVVPYAQPSYVECRMAAAWDAAVIQELFVQTSAEITSCLDPELWVETASTETSREVLHGGREVSLVLAVHAHDDGTYTLLLSIVDAS